MSGVARELERDGVGHDRVEPDDACPDRSRAFGKNSSRVRLAIATGMPTNSAYVLSAAGSFEYIQSIVSRYAFMKRSISGLARLQRLRLVMSRRTVWPLNTAASLPLAIMRILPSSSCCSPNGGADQPTSIWPDITCVSVGAGPPVAVGFALRSYCFMKAVTMPCVDEPLVE